MPRETGGRFRGAPQKTNQEAKKDRSEVRPGASAPSETNVVQNGEVGERVGAAAGEASKGWVLARWRGRGNCTRARADHGIESAGTTEPNQPASLPAEGERTTLRSAAF